MKKKQQTIFVVTSGEYSDYRIEAVFTDKCKAEKYVDEDAGYSCGRRIEEFEANACQFRKEGLWREVFIPLSDKDGDIKICNSVVSVDTICAKFRNEGEKICGYEFTVYSISASQAQAVALERYHALLAVKNTHFPFLAVAYKDSWDRTKGVVYGYFDYCVYAWSDDQRSIQNKLKHLSPEQFENIEFRNIEDYRVRDMRV